MAPRFGDGRQHWPWISLRDEARALAFALRQADLTGPVNLAGPTLATADEVIAALARALGRSAWLRLPAALLRAALGETAQELILASQPAVPAALVKAGFEFLDPTPVAALASALSPASPKPSGAPPPPPTIPTPPQSASQKTV
ncbi:MAG: DUF1731 domain-containing protein [Bifidobacteriaceae bacterium]|nr:DUF1731 domain-containing protein [Bifidobacteriaceae bacterium]